MEFAIIALVAGAVAIGSLLNRSEVRSLPYGWRPAVEALEQLSAAPQAAFGICAVDDTIHFDKPIGPGAPAPAQMPITAALSDLPRYHLGDSAAG